MVVLVGLVACKAGSACTGETCVTAEMGAALLKRRIPVQVSISGAEDKINIRSTDEEWRETNLRGSMPAVGWVAWCGWVAAPARAASRPRWLLLGGLA